MSRWEFYRYPSPSPEPVTPYVYHDFGKEPMGREPLGRAAVSVQNREIRHGEVGPQLRGQITRQPSNAEPGPICLPSA